MCFAPQRCALFRHLNFQKWSNNGVSCTFWLRNVLRATTAALFRDLTFQKWSDNGVFCAFWLGNVLRATTACNFSSLICPAGSAPAGVSRLSYLFAHLHLLSSDSFSSTLVSSNLSLLSASALLCFSSVHIVGSLTSKLPSTILAPHYHPSTYSKHVGFPEPLGPPEDIRLQQLLWLPHRSRCGSGCTSGSPSEQWEQRVSMLNTCLTVT